MIDINNFSTPHVSTSGISFDKTVLMPGDPMRAKMIADNFLKDVKVISDIRGNPAYSGTYKGVHITVMASGMGMPTIGLYAHELFNFFGVENIIRIGTAGAINKNLKIGDLVIATGACTNSNYANNFIKNGTFAPIADFSIASELVKAALNTGYRYKVGNILSSDAFYSSQSEWEKMGVLAVEMEAAALFTEAAMADKKAAAICTISDLIFDNSIIMSAEERQDKLRDMITVALNAAIVL